MRAAAARFLGAACVLCISASLSAAEAWLSGAPAIRQALARLKTVGRVLMIAAHPDDENTAVLAYLARGRRLRTGYLSLTRGEGGQNRIGPERGRELGVIRTQELLAARRIDGAEQFFTSALDFGFSKSVEETLARWGRERILGEVVRTIRVFQPDVIILRFTGTASDGHGHHQASAILGKEAFRAAADPRRFAGQGLRPWKAMRLVSGSRRPTGLALDAGAYDPVLGKSYAEIAGASRSMHKSQGFGSAEGRGSQKHFFVHVDGKPAIQDLFEGIDATWRRRGKPEVDALLSEAERQFDADHPGRIIPLLLKLRPFLADEPDKAADLDEAIALSSGLWLDANAAHFLATPGEAIEVRLTVLNRSPHVWSAARVRFPAGEVVEIPGPFPYNQPVSHTARAQALPDWTAGFEIDGLRLRRPVAHRSVDPVEGERTRPVAIVPPVAVDMPPAALLFPDPAARRIAVRVRSNAPTQRGALSLRAAPDWRIEPAMHEFVLASPGDQRQFWFTVTPPASPASVTLRAAAAVDGREMSQRMHTVAYPHIPPQIVLGPAERKLVRADVRVLAKKVGYIEGAGDEIPEALAQIGCEVTLLSGDDLATRPLSDLDAIVTGVRAYSVRPELAAAQPRLLEYVRGGGALIVQYESEPPVPLGPFPFRVAPPGRGTGRVSVEEAPVTILNPKHPLVTTPNLITPADFTGWVQERGLYFAETWDPRYQTVLASHDPGDPPLAGGLLFARYGKGVYIYTAYAWFRQLPEGVPGAFRLYANLLSAGKVRYNRSIP
jgi:LmbE family N-acetylglucosaminyl deacetylase